MTAKDCNIQIKNKKKKRKKGEIQKIKTSSLKVRVAKQIRSLIYTTY